MTIEEKTATPILTPSAINTLIPSAIPTDVPTLPADHAYQRLLALLVNNNDCRLPCLWGITPGKSSYLEARSILLPLRGIAETAYFSPGSPDSISPLYVEGTQRLNSQIDYWYSSVDGTINIIRFRALEERVDKKDEYGNPIKMPVFDSKVFQERTNYYSLAHVLSEQGAPDEVWLQAWGPLTGGGMDIALLYPTQGIWINYSMKVIYNDGIVKRACPVNSHIEMQLFPSGDSASFFSMLNKTDWGVTKTGYLPLEKATSLSLQEFYETFRIPTEECIETPVTLWPTPEGGG